MTMKMKKKIAASIGAVLMTALCFGSTAFAAGESVAVNGSGTAAGDTKEGQTEVKMEYTVPDDSKPTWSVNIPKTVDFGSISSTSSDLTKNLNYSATIDNHSLTGTAKLASLKISLPDKNTMALNDSTHGTNIANAFSILNTGSTEVTKSDTVDNSIIATLTEANPIATAYAKLNRDSFVNNSAMTSGTSHAFSGSFSILITPVAATV